MSMWIDEACFDYPRLPNDSVGYPGLAYDVWIGGNVTILPGVTIGNGSTIGAGSVVIRDIPEGSIAVGNPCRVVKTIVYSANEVHDPDHKTDLNQYEK